MHDSGRFSWDLCTFLGMSHLGPDARIRAPDPEGQCTNLCIFVSGLDTR